MVKRRTSHGMIPERRQESVADSTLRGQPEVALVPVWLSFVKLNAIDHDLLKESL